MCYTFILLNQKLRKKIQYTLYRSIYILKSEVLMLFMGKKRGEDEQMDMMMNPKARPGDAARGFSDSKHY